MYIYILISKNVIFQNCFHKNVLIRKIGVLNRTRNERWIGSKINRQMVVRSHT